MSEILGRNLIYSQFFGTLWWYVRSLTDRWNSFATVERRFYDPISFSVSPDVGEVAQQSVDDCDTAVY